MKVARTVLRGERGSNAPDLLDYHRLFLRSHGVLVDYPGRRCGSLRAEGQQCREDGRKRCGGSRWGSRRIGSRTHQENVLNVSLKKTERRHGVQIIKKHRDIIPAATAVRNGIPGSMRTGNGLRHLKGIRVCRSAAAENLCVGQRKVADAGTLAGRAAEPPRGSEGTYQTFPRTVFHPVTGQERH